MKRLIPFAALAAFLLLPSVGFADETMKTTDGRYWTVKDDGSTTITDTGDPAKKLSGSYVIDTHTWKTAPTTFYLVGKIERPLGFRYDFRLVAVGDYVEIEGADPFGAGFGLLLPEIPLAKNVYVDAGGRVMFRNGEKPVISLLFGVTVKL
jgi:hypothetical protein